MRILIKLILIMFTCPAIYADTVYLKSGKTIADAEILSEGLTYSIKVSGATIHIPADQVDHIEKQVAPAPVVTPKPQKTHYVSQPTFEIPTSPEIQAIEECQQLLRDENRGYTDSCVDALTVIKKLYIGAQLTSIQIDHAFKYIDNPMMWNALERTKSPSVGKLKEFMEDPDGKIQTNLKQLQAEFAFIAEQEDKQAREKIRQKRIAERESNVETFYETSHSGVIPMNADVLRDDPRFAWIKQEDIGYKVTDASVTKVTNIDVPEWKSFLIKNGVYNSRENLKKTDSSDHDDQLSRLGAVDKKPDPTSDYRFDWCYQFSGKFIYSDWVNDSQRVFFEYLMQAPMYEKIILLKNGGIVFQNGFNYTMIAPSEIASGCATRAREAADPQYYHPLHMHPLAGDHGHFSVPPWQKQHKHSEPVFADDPPRSMEDLRNDSKYDEYWTNYKREQEEREREEELLQKMKEQQEVLQDRALREQRSMLREDRQDRERMLRESETRMRNGY